MLAMKGHPRRHAVFIAGLLALLAIAANPKPTQPAPTAPPGPPAQSPSPAKPAPPANAAPPSVTIQGMAFSPATLNCKVGDTVVWTNSDDRDHTVIANDGSFKSGNISSTKTFEYKFTAAGTFTYYCKYHPRMKGTIVVAAK